MVACGCGKDRKTDLTLPDSRKTHKLFSWKKYIEILLDLHRQIYIYVYIYIFIFIYVYISTRLDIYFLTK